MVLAVPVSAEVAGYWQFSFKKKMNMRDISKVPEVEPTDSDRHGYRAAEVGS